jgi:uncharacterized protein (TIGR02646 family)
MIRIDLESSHIEHLKPQAVSKAEGRLAETCDYSNMVTCYPRAHRAGDPEVTFGAIFRADEWEKKHFVSPLTASCESRIRFGTAGQVGPGRSNDEGAKWTITTLGIDDSRLTALRLAAIEGRGVSLAADDAVTRGEAEQIVASICKRDGDGRFHPYCVAIKHAAEDYLASLDKAARRQKYAVASMQRARR